jgi:hypothetical protein
MKLQTQLIKEYIVLQKHCNKKKIINIYNQH